MYVNRRQNSFVKDGVLYLQPTLTADALGDAALRSGVYSMWGGAPGDMCTSNQWWGCERTASGTNILNPIQSARLRSVNSFNFKYGRVEVVAQMPKGDWIWPAIWMLPTDQAYGTWPTSGEIDILESRGNDVSCAGGSNTFGSTLHWGPAWNNDPYFLTHAEYSQTASLSDAMHTYGLYWSEEKLYTYIDSDDNRVLEVDFTQPFWEKGGFSGFNPWEGASAAAPFDQEFYLIFNVAVGGINSYFPDGQCGKPWSNTSSQAAYDFYAAKDTWYPTWNYPATNQAAMKIDSVKVWQFTDASEFTQ